MSIVEIQNIDENISFYVYSIEFRKYYNENVASTYPMLWINYLNRYFTYQHATCPAKHLHIFLYRITVFDSVWKRKYLNFYKYFIQAHWIVNWKQQQMLIICVEWKFHFCRAICCITSKWSKQYNEYYENKNNIFFSLKR